MDAVDLDDARVREAGDRASLASEPPAIVLVHRELRFQDLDSDLSAEGLIVALVDVSHAAGADLLHHLVLPDPLRNLVGRTLPR